MLKCASCGVEGADEALFCASCGAPLSGETLVTEGAEGPSPTPARIPSAPKPRSGSSSSSTNEGRFLPGALIAGRYRIVALLGKGGMGEVYRADDLTLGQQVALKFLREATAKDEALLERFRNEVRTARRVSHPNVCRVYDVSETGGHTFLTMEYVDGEDLASLVRRIGRLPGDKAMEIARQLCAGLAAAHREGVLHRDLKPANIMLDGRGRAMITDFGLAALADQIPGGDVRSGTPSYMAPEQLEGRAVTVRSDIYSLGLVLYEIFTGRRAFDGETFPEVVKQRRERPPSRPSRWVKEIDPAVERVILNCLEAEESRRPGSALAVATALPGGDPLAAALAAGETPSPETVAAAGEIEGIAPRIALTGLAGVIGGLVLVTYIGLRLSGLEMMHSLLPPESLWAKAQEIVKNTGYPDRPVDHAGQFYYNTDFTDYVLTHDLPRPNWPKVLTEQPQVLQYAYRQSPVYLDPDGCQGIALTPGVVQFDDPPAIQSGMVNVILDAQGRLTNFLAIPKEFEANPSPATPVDWRPLFDAAELDGKKMQPTQAQWVSLAAFDTRTAWTGTWPGSDRPLRVEAAAWRGKPVYFALMGPWTTPDRMEKSNTTTAQNASQVMAVILAILLLTSGVWIARRNYRKGRSDPHGAVRLVGAVFAIEMAIWVCRDHFIPTLATFGRFVLAVSTGLFISGSMGLLYMALEPYVRRHWPQAIVSWSRLMTGRIRDPLVGRDILWGVLLGVIWALVVGVSFLFLKRAGDTPQLPSTNFFFGGRQGIGIWLLNVIQAILGTLEFFFVLLLLRVALRNKWLAAGTFVAVWTTLNTLQGHHPEIMAPAWLVVFSIAAFAVTRFGLITLAVAIFTANVLVNLPYALDFSLWYGSNAFLVLLSFVAIAIWGFYLSLGGQKLWKDEAFE